MRFSQTLCAHGDYYQRLNGSHVPHDPLYVPDAVTLLANVKKDLSGHAVALELWEYFPVKLLHRRLLEA